MTALSPAPDLSPEEARRVAVFDAAEEPEEVVVERVARAIRTEWDSWTDLPVESDESSRRLAQAAIHALQPSPAARVDEEAAERVARGLRARYPVTLEEAREHAAELLALAALDGSR